MHLTRVAIAKSIKVEQSACDSIQLTQMAGDKVLVSDKLVLDGKYRKLASMPQFLTASIYDASHLIDVSKDAKSGKVVRIFNTSLSERGDFVHQTIKLDDKGNVVSSHTDVLPRRKS